MMIRLHKNATTTPAKRALIQSSTWSVAQLATDMGVSETTIRVWKNRESVEDRSHTAHHLQTTLTPAQEILVVELRKLLLFPLDDLLVVTREFINPDVSRSGLARCLRRYGVGNLKSMYPAAAKPAYQSFKVYEPGFLHIDVKYLPKMPDENDHRYLFVAIDRATRWVFIKFQTEKSAAAARAFLKELHRACPLRIQKILTDNGKEFTDRLFGKWERDSSGAHEFDQLCQVLGIEHRLTKPYSPKTNGMVERFNGRLAEVLATHHFDSAANLETTLKRYVWLYNQHLPQKALGHLPPFAVMQKWYTQKPDLFRIKPINPPAPDT